MLSIVCYLLLNGCVAALPVAAGLAVAGAAAGIYGFINLARDQYPDIDFEQAAPVETIYKNSFNEVWDATVDTLMEMKESTAMMDKNSGVIRTVKKNLNDVTWIGKGLGKATFLYEYNITVRPNPKGVSVAIMVPFWEEKVFVAAKEKNIPEGSNMMRHIFFRNLNQRITPIMVRMPDSPLQDIRHAPLTQETRPKDTYSGKAPQRFYKDTAAGDTDVDRGIQKSQLNEGYIKVKIKKTSTSINVRSVPFTQNNTPIASLKGGTEVELLEEKGDWLRVRFEAADGSEKEGWIYKYAVEGYNK